MLVELHHPNGAGYDGLNQVKAFARGALSDTNSDNVPDTIAAPRRSQSWSINSPGNYAGVTTNGVLDERNHNKQNQITSLTVGGPSLTYDGNSNLTGDGTWTYTYDAWNRLVRVALAGNPPVTMETNAYDPLGRRASETAFGHTTHLSYNQNWQVVEERVDGTANSNVRAQYLWSPVESGILIFCERDSDNDGSLDERLYVRRKRKSICPNEQIKIVRLDRKCKFTIRLRRN